MSSVDSCAFFFISIRQQRLVKLLDAIYFSACVIKNSSAASREKRQSPLLFAEQYSFYLCAYSVIYGEMKLLQTVGLCLRNTYGYIAKSVKPSARTSRKTNSAKPNRLRRRYGKHYVL